MKISAALPWLLGSVLGLGLIWRGVLEARPPEVCPEGMQQHGARCCGLAQTLEGDRCQGLPTRCAVSQRTSPKGCVPLDERVPLLGGRVEGLPTDWDDTSRRSATQEVPAFDMDRHEVVEAAYQECVASQACAAAPARGEAGRPQTNITATEAATYCAWRGGALPTSAEFTFAAMGRQGRRYPWGDSGAVCRQAAHGLATGPCAEGATGPQLAGSHPSGATPEGILDLAGNVEEWVRSDNGYEARGGSWNDMGVTALRTFNARPTPAEGSSAVLGFRCVYAAAVK